MNTAVNEPTKYRKQPRFYARCTQDKQAIRQAQALRYRVFSEEMGAELETTIPAHDSDRFDEYCHHVLIFETATNRVIGCTRILTSQYIQEIGGFYSESEFDLSEILSLQGQFMEIGRTCVDPNYRNGAVITLLWSELARFMVENEIDYLMGCASVPMPDDRYHPLLANLKNHHMTKHNLRAHPKRPLRSTLNQADYTLTIPSLLKAYLRLGAEICGEPCWDPAFKVADIFILLNKNNLQQRYTKHFINRQQSASLHEVAA